MTSTDILLVTAYLNDRIVEFAARKRADGVRVRIILLGEVPAGLDASGCELLELLPLELKKEAAAG